MGSQKNWKRNARRRRASREAGLEPNRILKPNKPKTKVLALDLTGGRLRVEYKVNFARQAIGRVIALRERSTLLTLNPELVPKFLTEALESWNLVKHGELVPISLDAMMLLSIRGLDLIVSGMADDIGKPRAAAY